MGGDAASVVGDQDGARLPEDLGHARGQRPVGHTPVALVDADERLPGRPYPDLAGARTGHRHADDLGVRRQQLFQAASGPVVADRGDQDDVVPGHPGRESGRQARAAGPLVLAYAVDDRNRRVGAQALGGALEIDVEQRVADDHQRSTSHEASLAPPSPSPSIRRGTAASTAAQSMWMAARWTSWMVAVHDASTVSASAQTPTSGFGAGPVSAQARTPMSAAALAAAITLRLPPLVDRQTRTSPGRPCARTCRANISSGP